MRTRGGLGVLIVLLAGCGTQLAAPSPSARPPAAFRVIGYVTDTGLQISDEQLDQLTHVNYAFALPQRDGSLNEIANPWKLRDYVERAHIATMRAKTELAMDRGSGLMIWTVADDSTDETSLLRAIRETVGGE